MALISATDIDAIVIATPVDLHFELGMAALRAGKHLLVEKPIASSSAQAARLVDEAARRRLVLMVDHTFVYTGAVRKIRELVAGGELGDVYYYDSTRVNLGLFQHDVNVLWDLAVHDLSIMDFVLARNPVAVSATGHRPCAGPAREHSLYHAVLRRPADRAHPCELARAGQGAAHADRRQPPMIVYDDLETEREGQGLRQGHLGESESRRTSTRCLSATAPEICGRRTST